MASTFTYAMGQAWLTVCQRVAKGSSDRSAAAIDNEQLREAVPEEFRNRLKLGRKEMRDERSGPDRRHDRAH